MTLRELQTLSESYRRDLAEASRQGKSLRDPETREVWEFFKRLLEARRQHRQQCLLQPQLYN